MSDTIIKVKKLSKRYRIGAKEQGYKTFREAIIDGLLAPIKNYGRLRKLTKFEDSPSKDKSAESAAQDDIIWALRDVSFKVKQGEVVGIIGRNGAGKTTLLKILSRITEPTSGDVKLYGRVSSLLEVGTGFHPELTGRENIYLNGAILGMRKDEIKRKFDEIVDFAEIEKFLDTPVKRYSSGMYVRLAFAVAAHLEPEILLVDEILAVGDAAFQKKCLGKMGDVANEGRTVLFVSHNIAAINSLCSGGIWLHNGQVNRVGSTTEIVGSYLAEGTNRAAQVFFERRANAIIQYRSACVTDGKGNVSQYIPDNQDFRIELEIEVYKATSDIFFGLILQNSEGVNVLFADSRDVEHSSKRTLRNGKHRICLHFPAIFSPGRYSVDLGIVTRNSLKQLDFIEAACSFEIEKNSNMQRIASRPGIINLNLPWELEECSK